MEPNSNNPNNFFGGDDNLGEANASGPMITGLPENQFTPPQTTPYAANSYNYQNPNMQPQEPNPEVKPVDPFVPPEYESVHAQTNPGQNTVGQNQSPTPRAGGEVSARQNSPRGVPQIADPDQEIANWRAQNLVTGEKNKLWYLAFMAVAVILLGLAWLAESWTFAVLIVVSAVAVLVVLSSNNVRQISYSLSNRGFYIDGDLHEYTDFKSFGILKENNIFSIVFLPKKRFAPSVSIYFPEENGEQIVDILGSKLPMEEIKPDFIDRIVRKLKL